jgi:predicted DNA-binding transcriptional regulator YafY
MKKKRGRHQGRYSQAARLFMLLDHLRGAGLGRTYDELATEFEVDRRQIRRDLEVLEQVGFPIDRQKMGGRVYVRLEPSTKPYIVLSLRQRYALLAARRVFDLLADTPFHEDIRAIYDKVVASLPEKDRIDIDQHQDKFVCLPVGGPKRYRHKQDVLDGLLTGVLHRLRVRFRYTSAGGRSHTGLLEPYAMVLYKQGLYVVGANVEPEPPPAAARVYAVERFTSAEHVKGSRFVVPPGFRVEDYFDGSFGIHLGEDRARAVIDFTPAVSELVRSRTWHPTQVLRPRPGGGLRLRMDVTNPTELCSWILSWGPQARVVEPPELIERVARELREAARQYAPGD